MVNYEKIFEPYYEGGWEAYPLETTLITAGALNDYDAAIMHIEDYLANQIDPNDNLAETYDDTATYEVGDYCVYNGVLYKCITAIDEAEEFDLEKWDHVLVTDEMGHGGGGSNVSITPTLSTGTKIADFEIDGQTGELYAPTGGGGNANIWTGTQAELEEVFDELEEGTQINITDDEQEVVEGGTIYSEDEQVIGIWTDNKPLYEKTYNLGQVANADTFPTNIDDLGEIISILGTAVNNTANQKVAIPYYYSSTYWISAFLDSNDNIDIRIGSGFSYIYNTKVTIRYTKTTDAPLDAVVGKKTMYIASSDCYSTEEKEIGCFTDGKPMYQKTLYFDGTIPRNTWTAHNISDVDKIWVFDAFGKRSTDYRYNGINYVSDTDYTAVFVNKTQVYISYATDNTMTNGYITVRYTKTTDTAGSGSYTPASGKAVHYSTDEQVIGTWVDGSTLYRKVFNLSTPLAVSSQQWATTDIPTSSLNVETLVNSVCICDSAIYPCAVSCDTNDTYVSILSVRTVTVTVKTLIIEYTKTTD